MPIRAHASQGQYFSSREKERSTDMGLMLRRRHRKEVARHIGVP